MQLRVGKTEGKGTWKRKCKHIPPGYEGTAYPKVKVFINKNVSDFRKYANETVRFESTLFHLFRLKASLLFPL